MSTPPVEFLSAVLLYSRQPERLARFYKDVLGMPLSRDAQEGPGARFGCELGDLYFAIHPVESDEARASNRGPVRLAFEIFDMEAFLARLSAHGVETAYPPRPLGGTSIVTAVRDPDGNEIEFTQLSSGWFHHLEKRRALGFDILKRWRQRRPRPKAA